MKTATPISDRGLRMGRWGYLVAATAGLAATALGWSCYDDDYVTSTDVSTALYYPYAYYYPADVALASTYWIDPWYYDPFYYRQLAQTTTRATDPGAVMRALATGVSVCGDQAKVVEKFGESCLREGGKGQIRSGATITFNGCMLSGGGRVDGMVDITSTPTLSDQNCDANTVVSVSFSAHYTGLAYTAPDGTRVTIPDQTNTGSYTRKGTAGPTGLAITSNGSVQRYDASGARVSDHTYSGSRNYRFANASYVLNGTMSVQDTVAGGIVSITGVEVTRTRDCCRPTAGTITVSGSNYDTATWVWGPSCGAATLNGTAANLAACDATSTSTGGTGGSTGGTGSGTGGTGSGTGGTGSGTTGGGTTY
jgi:hypothetical protein